MFVRQFVPSIKFVCPRIFLAVGVVAALSSPSWADQVKIASVSPEYRPTAGAEMPEPVSMQSFSFQVQPDTGRARVVVEYTYPDQAAYGMDGGAGPQPTLAQLPGLKYDKESKSVVYDSGGKRTVCATVRDRAFLFWKGLSTTPTGACSVVSRLADHAEDDGWSIHRFPALDTYLDVH